MSCIPQIFVVFYVCYDKHFLKVWEWFDDRFLNHDFTTLLETVPKKMRLVFWALADLLLIFCKFGIKYIKSFMFSAFKWVIVHFCTYLESTDMRKNFKKKFFQFYHFCKKKLVKIMLTYLNPHSKFGVLKAYKGYSYRINV